MFQRMLNASRAVLTRPSVSTFEEFEQDDLGAATVYVLIGAAISAVLGAIAYLIQRPYIEARLQELQGNLQNQLDMQLPADFAQNLSAATAPTSLIGAIGSQLIWALIGFFIFLGIVYLLGRLFGGTGTFGQLAYDISLFWAPVAVLRALIGIASFGWLSWLAGIASLVLGLYNLYLTYLGIQSGMNLPPNKALFVILIPLIIAVLGCCILAGGIAALIGAAGSR